MQNTELYAQLAREAQGQPHCQGHRPPGTSEAVAQIVAEGGMAQVAGDTGLLDPAWVRAEATQYMAWVQARFQELETIYQNELQSIGKFNVER